MYAEVLRVATYIRLYNKDVNDVNDARPGDRFAGAPVAVTSYSMHHKQSFNADKKGVEDTARPLLAVCSCGPSLGTLLQRSNPVTYAEFEGCNCVLMLVPQEQTASSGPSGTGAAISRQLILAERDIVVPTSSRSACFIFWASSPSAWGAASQNRQHAAAGRGCCLWEHHFSPSAGGRCLGVTVPVRSMPAAVPDGASLSTFIHLRCQQCALLQTASRWVSWQQIPILQFQLSRHQGMVPQL